MKARFTPSGVLDVSIDPGEFPVPEAAEAGAVTGNMVRCTNLILDRPGLAQTRKGMTKVSSTQLSTPIHTIIEQGGNRYAFGGTIIYKNELSIATGYTSAKWTGVKYNPYNATDQTIYATNGTDYVRINDTTVRNWGIAAPTTPPTLTGQATGFAYTYDWEDLFTALNNENFGQDANLFLYLPFDDGSGTGNLTDYSVSGADSPRTMTAVGDAASATTKYKFDSHALELDGTGDYITAPDSADFTNVNFSYDFFFYISDTVAARAKNHYFFHHATDANNYHTLYATPGAPGYFYILYRLVITGTTWVAITKGPVAIGTWHHVALTQEEVTAGAVYNHYLFVNGEGMASAVTGTKAAPNATGSFYIGADSSGLNSLEGFLDDICYWNTKKYVTDFTPRAQAYRYQLQSEINNPGFKWTRDYTNTSSVNYSYVHDWEDEQTDGLGGPDDAATYKGVWFWELQPSYDVNKRFGVVMTYVRKDSAGTVIECESNPSDAVYIEGGSGIILNWAAITDPQVTHVRFYRTLASGATYLYSDEFAAADLVGYLSKPDSELGDEVEYDHNPPPTGGSIVLGPDFAGYLFMAKNNLLYYSKAQRPEYWPATNYLEVSNLQDPIKSLRLFNGQVYCMTAADIHMVLGTGSQSFSPVRQSAVTGAVAQEGALALKGFGLLRVANDGLWTFTGAKDDNVSNPRFRPVFEGTTAGSIPGINLTNRANSWLVTWRARIYHAFPSGSATYPNEILRSDLGTGKTVHFNFNDTQFSCAVLDETNDRILAASSDGYIWILESGTDDGGTAIDWQVESGEFTQLYKYFPRYAKYDVGITSGTATGRILVNGTIKQSHTLSDRNTKKRHVATCTGDRLSLRIDGTGVATVYSAEVQ